MLLGPGSRLRGALAGNTRRAGNDGQLSPTITSRDTPESEDVRRRRLNSTLRSLLFWIILVVVGILIWRMMQV